MASFINAGQLVHKLQWKDTHIKKDSMDILRAYSYPSHLLGKKVERNGININSEDLRYVKFDYIHLIYSYRTGYESSFNLCVISGFRCSVNVIFALLGCYAALIGG